VDVPPRAGPALLLVHLLSAGTRGTADQHVATLPLLVLPEARACEEVGGLRRVRSSPYALCLCCWSLESCDRYLFVQVVVWLQLLPRPVPPCPAQVAQLWAGMVSAELERQAAAEEGSPGSTSISGQEAAAAAVAYGILSDFASELGQQLSGLTAVPEQRTHLLAFLQANSMHACQRLLAASSIGPGASAGAGQAQARNAAGPTQGASQEPAAKEKPQPPPAAAGVAGAAPGRRRRLRLRDVLLGFSDGREEAAFQLSKARELVQSDVWTAGIVASSGAMLLVAVAGLVLRSDDERAWQYWVICAVYWMLVSLPAAVLWAARSVYLSHRGWVRSVSILLGGVHAPVSYALLGELFFTMNQALIVRPAAVMALEFAVFPALLRVSPRHQVLASVGCALPAYYAQCIGPSGEPVSIATCLALSLGTGVLIAAGLELPARRRWLAAPRPEAAPAQGAGPSSKRPDGK